VLKIGEFSALTRVSIKTLRYYDELGILKPVRVDQESGYRYYSADQLPRLYRVLALKDLGFPLDRIAQTLEKSVSADELRGMLMLRRAEQEVLVLEEQERLTRLEACLRLIEREGVMTNEVLLKELPPQWIVSLRESIPAYRAIGALFGKVHGILGPLGAGGTGVALFHDKEFKDHGIDAEVGVLLKESVSVPAPLTAYELPAITVASIIHHGAFNRIAETSVAVLRWIEANKYQQAGPIRELFLRIAAPASRDDESNVTEIQVPVGKA
jgi:DNA-binding transcriptional MerR regulator/predicted transcriptional regulator YdeE